LASEIKTEIELNGKPGESGPGDRQRLFAARAIPIDASARVLAPTLRVDHRLIDPAPLHYSLRHTFGTNLSQGAVSHSHSNSKNAAVIEYF
jgi:hypothetical protein